MDSDTRALAWAVGAVSERLQISRDTLRTWDRRYGIGPSLRTEGGHRRYTEEDILRVRVMARFAARGVPAQTAARVALAMDSERLGIETLSGSSSVGSGMPGREAQEVVQGIAAAAAALEPGTLAELYRTTLRERDLVSAWTDVFSPALRLIGDQWGTGSLGVESEHLASEVLVTELRALVQANRPRITGTDVVLASADDEQHYLPLLALEAELARQGVGASLLGARVPTTSLEEVLGRHHPSKVFIWASLTRAEQEPLWDMLAAVSWPTTVVLGGPGWPSSVPPSGSAVRLARVESLRAAVAALLQPPDSPSESTPP